MSKTTTKEDKMNVTTDLWPIWENATSSRSIGYIVATDDIPGLPCPRIGEVYRTPRGWGAWAMGAIFGDEVGPRSALGFRTRRAAVAYLIDCARERAEISVQNRNLSQAWSR